jgi:hypothetical protein
MFNIEPERPEPKQPPWSRQNLAQEERRRTPQVNIEVWGDGGAYGFRSR